MNAKRHLANKQNAKSSTGPRTEAGKARSRLNATKHGGYAKLCIVGEDIKKRKALFLDLWAEFRPRGVQEALLVQEIADVIWRKNRYKLAEAKVIEAYSFADFGRGDEQGDVGLALMQDAGAYRSIPRCLASEEILDRRLWRHFDRLTEIQKERK